MRSGKVQILNNAIELEKYAFNPEARDRIRREYNIGKTDYVIGHVGRFMKQKNHKYLIDIFAEFNNKVPNSYLLLLGTGELEDEFHHYVNGRGLSDRVIFTGSVANVEDFYQAMDVFMLPSLYEGLPVVAIEAQAADLPVLISENVDHSCAITDNVSFIPVSENIDRWLDILDRTVCKQRGIVVVKQMQKARYSIRSEASFLEKIYL